MNQKRSVINVFEKYAFEPKLFMNLLPLFHVQDVM